ncbi:MAG: hypothetical protein PHU23_00165 [Dehalococcoidales bacterium]|nr:hypothetical protein [Dehalococcoidales bacterium]
MSMKEKPIVILPGTGFAVASTANDVEILEARQSISMYGPLIQVCGGTNDETEINTAIATL